MDLLFNFVRRNIHYLFLRFTLQKDIEMHGKILWCSKDICGDKISAVTGEIMAAYMLLHYNKGT